MLLMLKLSARIKSFEHQSLCCQVYGGTKNQSFANYKEQQQQTREEKASTLRLLLCSESSDFPVISSEQHSAAIQLKCFAH
jgi:hypothetical protein